MKNLSNLIISDHLKILNILPIRISEEKNKICDQVELLIKEMSIMKEEYKNMVEENKKLKKQLILGVENIKTQCFLNG